jgi:hypothetical protein
LLPIAATIGAPNPDGLTRAVSGLFRETPPSDALTPLTADAVEPHRTPAAQPPAWFAALELPARPGDSAQLQSLRIDTLPAVQPAPVHAERRGALITSMYVSFIALQALDAHSTIRALDRGARESNPVIEPFAHNTPALIALKAGTAAGVLYMTDRVRRHNKLASIVIMAAANSAYATIVARNYRIAARQHR